MKKYIRPTMTIVELDTTDIIALSMQFCSQGAEITQEEEVQAASYRSSLWED